MQLHPLKPRRRSVSRSKRKFLESVYENSQKGCTLLTTLVRLLPPPAGLPIPCSSKACIRVCRYHSLPPTRARKTSQSKKQHHLLADLDALQPHTPNVFEFDNIDLTAEPNLAFEWREGLSRCCSKRPRRREGVVMGRR